MRIAAFEGAGVRRHGLIVADEPEPAIRPLPAGTDPIALLAEPEGLAGLEALAGPARPLAGLRLLAPVRPTAIRDFVTFEEHVDGVRRRIEGRPGVPEQWYRAPTFYFSNPHSVLGPADDVPMPPGSRLFDFELEVAAVIGRSGRDLSPAQAREHLIGYTIFNDWSARDLQQAEMLVGLGPAKGKDTACSFGPWLVTADELELYRDGEGFLDLDLTAQINGRQVGHDRLANMGWTFEEMLAYSSRGAWVRTGDVLGSGTCGNGGCLAELWGRSGAEQPPALRPGDVVTLTVEGIGTLSSTIVAGAEPIELPEARHRLADRLVAPKGAEPQA